MTGRRFFAAFLVCILLLAGGLHLTARSLRELQGGKAVPVGIAPPRVEVLVVEGERRAGDTLKRLSARLREGEAIALWRETLEVIKEPELAGVVDRIKARVGPVLRSLETFFRPK